MIAFFIKLSVVSNHATDYNYFQFVNLNIFPTAPTADNYSSNCLDNYLITTRVKFE
jgi:hypothetical protein